MAHGRIGQHRLGLRPEPAGGWPLDALLVGVGTLRTLRELFRQFDRSCPEPLRAWDVALWSGVTPQGSIKAMDRIHEAGLVSVHPPDRPWRAVRYRLEPDHPLVAPLGRLFETERSLCEVRPGESRTSAGPGRAGDEHVGPRREDVTESSAPGAPPFPAGEPGTGHGR